MIVNYRCLEDAIYFIETNQSKLKVSDLNEALDWAGKNPKEFKRKR